MASILQKTILVVEDESIVLRVINSLLTKKGYRVLTAKSSAEALRHCENQANLPIDLLLTDIMIPGLSGPNLARGITTLCPNIQVIYMSGYTADIIAEKGLLDANSNFIEKSDIARSLTEKVQNLLTKISPDRG